jgi:hypothetical protein
MGLANMLDPRHLDLAVSQVQDNASLANMSDPRHLDLAISQIQGNDHPYLGTPKKIIILS